MSLTLYQKTFFTTDILDFNNINIGCIVYAGSIKSQLGHIVNFLLISYAHDTAAVKVIGQTVLQDHTWIRISLWNKKQKSLVLSVRLLFSCSRLSHHSDWIADIHKLNKKNNETISCENTHLGLTKSNLVSYHFQHSTIECCQNKIKHCSNTRI